MLKVSPWKGVIRFGKQGKLNPSTFHVSNLKKCLSDMPLDEIHIDDKLHFVEEPVEIMEREVKRLKQSRIPIIKVRWNSMRGPEFTWERENQFQKKYPHLFTKIAPRQVPHLEPCGQGSFNGGCYNRLVGDICYEEASKVASSITLVAGGVGPMTIAMLLLNILLYAKRIHNFRTVRDKERCGYLGWNYYGWRARISLPGAFRDLLIKKTDKDPVVLYITYRGYSDHMVCEEHFVLRWPDNLPLDSSAPLLYARITSYTSLNKFGLDIPDMKVGMVGLGGVGHVAAKMA
ncbi:putative reverse transcriptase domain-containing protein [Tanacetum coccineum]|uniref:Reverse transcriptase domain-containing protein n=1 Tax=Tanacetum coccineum TaxID=301880 RepID=A0ABQ5IA68_9ASTR